MTKKQNKTKATQRHREEEKKLGAEWSDSFYNLDGGHKLISSAFDIINN